jgi:retinol dehydrogenase 12
MKQRYAILTGAYGAIGSAIAEGLAKQGFTLVLAGRDADKLEQLTTELQQSTGNTNISFHALDLSRKQEIESFAQQWDQPLDLLVNNAATTPRSREETPEGIELQFATNVLGYFWMTQYFHPFMEGREDTRIVNVASYWAGDLDLNDLEFETRRYNNDTAYRQTKQANRMLTVAFAEKLADKNISVLAAHPGDVNSKLSNNLGYGGWESPQQGAATPLFCATDPSLKGITGKYFENQTQTPCRFSQDKNAVKRLFEICESY